MPEFCVLGGDCRGHLKGLPDSSFDAVVTDPPYELLNQGDKGIGNSKWDRTGAAFDVALWQEAHRALKPGGHLLAFAAGRTYHKLAGALEAAGFDVRDTIHWTYFSGMVKSQNIALMLDKYAGAQGDRGKKMLMGKERDRQKVDRYDPKTDLAKQFDGWGTMLRPTHEIICVARKPCDGGNIHYWREDGSDYGGVALNLVKHGVGGIRVDAARHDGKWPTNTVTSCDCDEEHEEGCPTKALAKEGGAGVFPVFKFHRKVGPKEKTGHLTQKPVDLMAWLIRLVVAPGGLVLDPFMGSGTTGVAALREGCSFVGMEMDPHFVEVARGRMASEGGTDVG